MLHEHESWPPGLALAVCGSGTSATLVRTNFHRFPLLHKHSLRAARTRQPQLKLRWWPSLFRGPKPAASRAAFRCRHSPRTSGARAHTLAARARAGAGACQGPSLHARGALRTPSCTPLWSVCRCAAEYPLGVLEAHTRAPARAGSNVRSEPTPCVPSVCATCLRATGARETLFLWLGGLERARAFAPLPARRQQHRPAPMRAPRHAPEPQTWLAWLCFEGAALLLSPMP